MSVTTEDKGMKEMLLETVAKLKEEGVDFAATPPLFNWSYPEQPDVLFQLLITPIEADEHSVVH